MAESEIYKYFVTQYIQLCSKSYEVWFGDGSSSSSHSCRSKAPLVAHWNSNIYTWNYIIEKIISYRLYCYQIIYPNR